MEQSKMNSLGIDIGSTTVKISILDPDQKILFSAYKRHYANIQETLSSLLSDAHAELGRPAGFPHDHRFRRPDAGPNIWAFPSSRR